MNVIERFRKYRKGGLLLRKFQPGGTLNLGETITSAQMKEMTDMWNYLVKTKKLSPRNAASIMGNVWQESRFDDKRVSSKGAVGFLQFLGQRLKDYNNYKAKNKVHPKYGQIDYILYAIQDPTYQHDLYRKDYEASKKQIDSTMQVYKEAKGEKNKAARKKDYENAVNYHNKVYGDREKSRRLYFMSELNDGFNNPEISTDSVTTLWHNVVERSNPNETNMQSRLNAANAFLAYFGSK